MEPTMPREIESQLLERIKQHAVTRLLPSQTQHTNLSVNRQIIEAGQHFGPPTQRLTAERPTLVVFADDDPLANWGHACRYLLYDAKTGELLKEIPARLPSGTLEAFYTPVQLATGIIEPPFRWPPRPVRCPVIVPDGQRYALLFAGFTMERHLNDLEFCYRTLVNVYGVPPENILVLSFNCSMTVVNDNWLGTSPAPALWPGDNTPYQIVINYQGTLAGLEAAFAELAAKIGPNDELFIHTNNHGDTDATGAYIGYPSSFPGGAGFDWGSVWVNLYSSTFASMLSSLPAFRALVVMMEQCGSGGFGPNILSSSRAGSTSFAAACVAGASSYGAVYNGAPWDAFAYQWIAAMAGEYPNGSPLLSNPDTDGSFAVDTNDAFNYANANGSSLDSPNISGAGTNPGGLVLAEEYTFHWFWCWLWTTVAQPFYEAALKTRVPLSEFYAKLNQAARGLQKEIIAESDKAVLEARRKLGPQVKQALEAVLKDLGAEPVSR
jgi:hypothetical protein